MEIDGFTVGDRVHEGGMGGIHRVTRDGDSRRLLMKIPRVGPNEPSEGIISFETEATILPTLKGPHVPQFVAAGDITKTPYLVMEWIDGTSLDQFVHQGALPVSDVTRVGAAIADALHSLHRQDVIHLDLKPSNIIVKHDGTIALVDFGFAYHARYPDLLGEETRAAGSAPYISPEQVQHIRSDPRSDLFSLGVVLYEMATGALPFGEPDTDVRNRLWLDPVPPSVHSPEVPPWLQEIILRCLEVRPDERYQSAAHVAFDLRNPEQVILTARARKSHRASLFKQVKRFWTARQEHGRRLRMPHAQLSRSPIVMVAVDTSHPDDERQPAIRRAASQLISVSTEFRLIAVSVIGSVPLMDGKTAEETASGLHLQHLVRLRHWVEPLRMPAQRLSLHVIESEDAAQALLDFARLNNVDLIILGAPGPATPGRSWWRSVASTVTANAQCSVHVVRVPGRPTMSS
jgi:eukaryotic-like serine/threonine-protein kinase